MKTACKKKKENTGKILMSLLYSRITAKVLKITVYFRITLLLFDVVLAKIKLEIKIYI